jgi:hypothetical protein
LVGDSHCDTATTFVAATPAATLSGEPVGWQIWVTRAARPLTEGVDAEDALDRALRAEIRTNAAPGGTREKDADEGRVEEEVEVGGGRRSGRRRRGRELGPTWPHSLPLPRL